MHLPDRLKESLASPPYQVVARLILGGLFIYASLDKIAQPAQFARAIESYQLLPLSLLLWLPTIITGIPMPSSANARAAAVECIVSVP